MLSPLHTRDTLLPGTSAIQSQTTQKNGLSCGSVNGWMATGGEEEEECMEVSDRQVDEALSQVSGCYPWHLTLFILVGLSGYSAQLCQKMAIVFIGWTPPHHCRVPDNLTVEDAIPKSGDALVQCSRYIDINVDNRTAVCSNGWTYLTEGRTIVTDWDLVCDRDYLVELSQTLFQGAELSSQVFCAWLIDRYGRRWTHIISILLTASMGTAVSFSNSYVTFLVLRTFLAFQINMAMNSSDAYLVELYDASRRSVWGVALEYLWTSSYLLLGIIGYMFRDWQHFQLATSLPLFLSVAYIWILPESIPWLVANRRYQETEDTLQRMARNNRITVQGPLFLKGPLLMTTLGVKTTTHDRKYSEPVNKNCYIKDPDTEKDDMIIDETFGTDSLKKDKMPFSDGKKSTVKSSWKESRIAQLFRDPVLRKHMLILGFEDFVNSLVYYALILSTPSLAGDRFLNYFISGLVEIPAVTVIIFAVRRSRRYSGCSVLVITGVALGIAAAIPISAGGVRLSAVKTAFAMLGKFGVTASFAVFILLLREVFPTNLRGTSYGISRMSSGIATMVAPFLAYAARHVPWVPQVIMAVLAVVGGIAILGLPETTGKPLPQTTADVYALYDKPIRPKDTSRRRV